MGDYMQEVIIFLFFVVAVLFIRKRMINFSNVKQVKNGNNILTPGVNEYMFKPEFWNTDNEIILIPEEIEEFNNSIRKDELCLYDLTKEDNIISYGIVIKQSEVRKYPSNNPDGNILDKNLLTTFKYGTGVVILDEEDEWFYVESSNYKGWILKNNVVKVLEEEMNDYVNSKDFVIVTENKIMLDNLYLLTMGVKIPIKKETNRFYLLKIIDRDYKGNPMYFYKHVRKDKYFNKDYLPYTTNNLIIQSFKMLGEPYIWGGNDCSNLILNVYSTFGINLPRDSKNQSLIKNNSMDKNFLNKLKIGSLLFTDGHVMMYIGDYNNKSYVIHSVFRLNYLVNGVTISSLYALKNNKRIIDQINNYINII